MKQNSIRTIRCWHCSKSISVEHAGQTCPHCMASLTSADYDVIARETSSQLKQHKQEKTKLEQMLNGQNDRRHKHKVRASFMKPWFTYKEKCLRADLCLQESQIQDLSGSLAAYAAARYCCSSWYQETGILPKSLGGVESPFRGLRYTPVGELKVALNGKSKELRGIEGEYRAFDLLSRYLEEGYFGYAKLVPSVFIPSVRSKINKRASAEIDMLLITEKRIFVIEVKNLNGEVVVSRSKDKGYEVTVRYRDNLGRTKGSRLADAGVSQNIRHCTVLKELLKGDFNRPALTNVVFYLNNAGFIEPTKQGKMGVYVVSDKAGPAFAPDVLRSVNKGSVRSRDEVDELYRYLKEFTDPTGEKSKQHRQRVAGQRQLNQMIRQYRLSTRYA